MTKTSAVSHSCRKLNPSSYFSSSPQLSWLSTAALLCYRELAYTVCMPLTATLQGRQTEEPKAQSPRGPFSLSSPATPYWSGCQFEAANTCQPSESDHAGWWTPPFSLASLWQACRSRHMGIPPLKWSMTGVQAPQELRTHPRQDQQYQAVGPRQLGGISQEVDPWLPWATCTCVTTCTVEKSVFLRSGVISWVSVCAHCLLSSQ